MAIKPVKDCTGTVTDQLDRLSAAFDAIQKYLEVNILLKSGWIFLLNLFDF